MIGNRVSHFEIVDKLGEGGMGVVYKARDLTLNRMVALKALTAGDTSRKQRFLQEAQAASALNHSNIVTVYEIFREGDDDFIAMELIDGKTLAESIGKKNFRLTEALKSAEQIASALAAAHGAGIVHRDLKPANVMMTADGHVKVLDFGLAKVVKPVRPSDATETLTSPLTEQGTVMGTVAYMSPEQAEGQEVDWRSDIFSFGSLLYEMVTGRRAFERESRVLTMSAVIEKEPETAADAPRELQRLIARCMKKKPAERAQSMVDVKHAIEEIRAELASGQMTGAMPAVVVKTQTPRWVWAAITIASVSLAAATYLWTGRSAKTTLFKPTPLTTYPGQERKPALSPDGKLVAFSWNGPGEDNFDIYLRRIGAGEPVRLTTSPEADSAPVWSRDGDWIAFRREDGGIYVVAPIGGKERLVWKGPRFRGSIAGWTGDGKSLLIEAMHFLVLVNMESGEARRLTVPIEGLADRKTHFHFVSTAISPDGKQVALHTNDYIVGDQIFVAGLSESGQITGPGKALIHTRPISLGGLTWLPDGKSILFLQRIGESPHVFRLAVDGGAEAEPVPGLGGDVAAVTVAGNRLVYAVSHTDLDLWRLEVGAGGKIGPEKRIAVSSRSDRHASFSPDGRQLAFVSDRGGASDIWISNPDGAEPRQVTHNLDIESSPNWSPDGKNLLAQGSADKTRRSYVIPVNGGAPRIIAPPGSAEAFSSRDGKSIFYYLGAAGDGYQEYRIDTAGAGPGQALPGNLVIGNERPGIETPDGKWHWGTRSLSELMPSGSAGRIFVRWPATGGQPEDIDPKKPLAAFGYGRDGAYFVESGSSQLKFRRYADLQVTAVGEFAGPNPPRGRFTVSPDGKTIIHHKPSSILQDLMLVENFK